VSRAKLFAFLRAINVGGHTVTMDDLRRHFESLGLEAVETFIASGNVIFSTPGTELPALERRIEARLRKALGYEVKTFLRTVSEMAAIARYRPFPDDEVRSAGALCVGFVAEPLGAGATRALATLQTEIDEFHVHGREVYWICKLRQSESKFSNVRFEKTTGISTTFRGVNTIARLAAKHCP
jgi:uncharacterized protein (DUF1697 family)